MNLTFPTLYKKTSSGKIQEWVVSVECSDIIVTYGLQGGKKKVDRKTIKKGKNIGKVNETSPHEQAALESESKWKKQTDSGYVEDLSKVDDIVYLPMLAHPYSKIKDGKEKGRKKYMKMPCVGQRKFDGCLHYDTLVELKNIGKVKIGDVVSGKYTGLIKSYNIKLWTGGKK